LLIAAKTLFAESGYEQTSTAAIARNAGTSESQLVRYFGGKRGLLTAIFDDSWRQLNQLIDQRVAKAADPVTAIQAVFLVVIHAFQRDPELAYLLLFEGRRVREGGRRLELSQGYKGFVRLLQQLIRSAQRSGTIARSIAAPALASALMGAAEGMVRDLMIAKQSGQRQPFSRAQMVRVFEGLLLVTAWKVPRLASTKRHSGTVNRTRR
jgi:AcrR family transcriptional regulator